MPLVSIVTPVLNERHVLPRCLDSVLGQTHADLEVLVVVDEKSRDGSVDLCHEYAARDNRVKVLRDPGNVSTARNRGLEAATGEYLQFVDADDAVAPEMTATLLDDIKREKTDWASCAALFIQEGGGGADAGQPSHLPCSRGKFPAAAWIKRLACPEDLAHSSMCWNKLYSMKVIRGKAIRFPSGMAFAEDHIFNLDYLAACDSVLVGDKPLYRYLEGAGPEGYLTIRKFHPQCIDFIDSFCRKLMRVAAPYCSEGELNSLRQAMAGMAVLNVVRFCRRDSIFTVDQTLKKLAEVASRTDLREWLSCYRPAPGQSRLVPFLLRHRWIRPLFYAARRRADERYGEYYARPDRAPAGTA